MCNADTKHTLQCAGELQGPVSLKLRERCPDYVIDTYWTPQTEEVNIFSLRYKPQKLDMILRVSPGRQLEKEFDYFQILQM